MNMVYILILQDFCQSSNSSPDKVQSLSRICISTAFTTLSSTNSLHKPSSLSQRSVAFPLHTEMMCKPQIGNPCFAQVKGGGIITPSLPVAGASMAQPDQPPNVSHPLSPPLHLYVLIHRTRAGPSVAPNRLPVSRFPSRSVLHTAARMVYKVPGWSSCNTDVPLHAQGSAARLFKSDHPLHPVGRKIGGRTGLGWGSVRIHLRVVCVHACTRVCAHLSWKYCNTGSVRGVDRASSYSVSQLRKPI